MYKIILAVLVCISMLSCGETTTQAAKRITDPCILMNNDIIRTGDPNGDYRLNVIGCEYNSQGRPVVNRYSSWDGTYQPCNIYANNYAKSILHKYGERALIDLWPSPEFRQHMKKRDCWQLEDWSWDRY